MQFLSISKTNADRLLHIGYDATRAVFINVAVNGTEPTAYKAPFSVVIQCGPSWVTTKLTLFMRSNP